MIAVNESITLEGFLELPGTKPVCEYVNGKIFDKPMPKSRHSLLQSSLCSKERCEQAIEDCLCFSGDALYF
jgi:hypothetical protein